MRATKEKGPAATAIAPDPVFPKTPIKGNPMNIHTPTSAAPRCKLTEREFNELTDNLFSKVNVLQRQAYILNRLIEESLNQNRGKVDGDTVTLMFQKRGIDVIEWLAGEAWSGAVDIVDMTDKLIESFEVAS